MATKKTSQKAKVARPLTRAPHPDPAAIPLNAAERTLLNEALRRGEDVREQVEAAVTSFGRWLLGAVFRDDAAAALDDRTQNPVWRELVRRAGGPSLKVSRHMLYVAVQLAARDKRIPDQTWRGLDAGRKELLLPLHTDEQLREAAQHVAKWNLTHASTRQYVAEVLKGEGKKRLVRLTVPRLVLRVHKLRETLGGPSVLRRVDELRTSVKPEERSRAADEIDKLRGVLAELSKALRKR